jgi:preprotein translocase subunit SecG
MLLETLMKVVQVLVALAMTGFILVQRGAGAQAGSGFGAGASGTVFGARGSGSFLTRTTAILATVFFVISMAMAMMASRAKVDPDAARNNLGVMSSVVESQAAEVPTAPAATPAATDVPTAPADAAPVTPAADPKQDATPEQKEPAPQQ